MLRGRPLPVEAGGGVTAPPPATSVATGSPQDRVLSTAEANAYLRRAKGFLEKRRSSGIDSPPYIQRTKRGAVLYRVSDLLAWEEERMLTASSDHDDSRRAGGCGRVR